MIKWTILFLAALSLSAATPDAKTEKEVMDTLNAYRSAMMSKDTAALNKIFADEMTYSHSSALHQTKAEVIDSLKTSTYDAIDFKNTKIQVYGNTATVKTDADFKTNGSLVKLNVLHVFVKGKQGWQLVARQAVRYPDTAAK
jgi:hypothetical protein